LKDEYIFESESNEYTRTDFEMIDICEFEWSENTLPEFTVRMNQEIERVIAKKSTDDGVHSGSMSTIDYCVLSNEKSPSSAIFAMDNKCFLTNLAGEVMHAGLKAALKVSISNIDSFFRVVWDPGLNINDAWDAS